MGAGAASSRIQVGQFTHQFAGFADAGFGFSCPRFRAAAKPLDFSVNEILQRFLALRLCVQKLFFFLQKVDVAAVDAQRALGVNAIEFDHVGGDILEKVAVVADDDAGKCRRFEQLLEPGDSGKIQMIGWLVEQQDVGMLDQGFDNCQTLLPSAG